MSLADRIEWSVGVDLRAEDTAARERLVDRDQTELLHRLLTEGQEP